MVNFIALAACLQAPFYLHNGDRVTFYGDSITEDGRYGLFVEMFVRTRMPNLDVRFTNCGWGGDQVTGGGGGNAENRINLDFKPTNPTVVTIMLGMNDGHYTPWSAETDKAFGTGYDKLISLMLGVAPKARYTLIQTSPYDDFAHEAKHYNDVLLQMGAHVKELASKYKFDYVDFNTPLVDMLKEAAHDDAKVAATIFPPDQIHPQEAGHLLMATTLLKHWGAPSLVSEVTVDGKTGDIQKTLGTKVSKTGFLEWKQTDDALPMPINWNDPAVRLIAESAGIVDALDDETLTISDLQSGTYSIKIDGKEVGKASADDLGKGLNLSHFPTPMMMQAFNVGGLVYQKVHINMIEWREIRRSLGTVVNTEPSTKALQGLEEELVKKAQAAAAPQTHTFSVSKES